MDKNALNVLLLTVAIIVIVNFVLFAIVRGFTRGDNRWIRAIGETLSKPNEKNNKSYDELHQRLEQLGKNEEAEKKEE